MWHKHTMEEKYFIPILLFDTKSALANNLTRWYHFNWSKSKGGWVLNHSNVKMPYVLQNYSAVCFHGAGFWRKVSAVIYEAQNCDVLFWFIRLSVELLHFLHTLDNWPAPFSKLPVIVKSFKIFSVSCLEIWHDFYALSVILS